MNKNRKLDLAKRNRIARKTATVEAMESRTLMAAIAAIPAPSNLLATTMSESQLEVDWADNSTDETRFLVQRARASGKFISVATLPADSTSFTDGGLEPLTSYRYRVKASTDATASRWSTLGRAVTSSWLSAEAVAPSEVQLSWTNQVVGESQFLIDRAIGNGSFKRLAALPADTTEYSDASVTPSTAYRYRIQAISSTPKLKLATANALTPATMPIIQPPAAPSRLAASPVSSTRVDLTWADDSSDESGFVVDWSTDTIGWTQLTVLAPSTTGAPVEGLASNTTYQFRVRAFNNGGDSAYSNTAGATTLPVVAPPTFAVTRLVLVNADTDLDVLDLTPGVVINLTDLGTQNLNVRAETTSGAESVRFVLDGAEFRTESSAPFALGGDAAGDYLPWTPAVGPHTLQVTPYAQDGGAGEAGAMVSIPFSVVNSQPQPTQPPLPASNLRTTATSTNSINLAWADNSSNETGFKVERSADGGTSWVPVGTVAAGVTAYAAGGLSPSATYSFRVNAFNTAGDSAYSNVINASTAAMPTLPAAPTGLTATAASATQINLAWSDASGNETGFKVERSVDGVNFTQVAAVGANAQAYAATGLSASTQYYFRVRATNAAGDSPYSNVTNATTTAAPQVGARPGPNNTGPTTPSSLQARGSFTISTAGAVVEGVNVNGVVTITANNVTLRNFRINAGGEGYAVLVNEGVTGTVLEDGEVTNFGEAVVYEFTNYTARRLNVHDAGKDGFKAEGNVVLEANWLHRLGMTPDAHADGVQVSTGSNIVVRGNFFDMPVGLNGFASNAAIIIKADFGPIDNVLFEGNWANGGNFTVYSRSGSGYPAPTNVRFLNNRFGRDYQYGIYSLDGAVTVSGNVWDDTGAPAND